MTKKKTNYWVLLDFDCVFVLFSGFDWVLPGWMGCYRVLLGLNGLDYVLLDLDWVALLFSGFDWVLSGLIGFYRVLPGFTGFH